MEFDEKERKKCVIIMHKKKQFRILTCLYIDPARALVDALSFCVLLDFSLTQVTADAVSEALTSACTSILLLKICILRKKRT